MKFKAFNLSPFILACGAALFSAQSLAQGDILGKVTDNNNKVFFQGALVEIKELNLKQVSERDGSFRFSNLADGSYTLKISYLGAKAKEFRLNIQQGTIIKQNFVIGDEDPALEEVIVFGQRASQAEALNRQKNAVTLKSIVSADSIGQFPDQNAAEALQRLPGLYINRDQGEGRFVGIRGLDPNLNNLTINGVNVPSPESGVRSVAMDVIPSELIEGLEVSKTLSADMDADAVGGSIDVKSLSAFDRQGRSYGFNVQGSHNKQTSDTSPKLSASFSDIFTLNKGNKLGIAAAVSWFERDFSSHNIETDGGWAELEIEDVNTGEDIEQFGAEEIEQRFYLISRERKGLALNLDYHTLAGSKYYLRTLYSKFADDEFRQRNEYKFDKGKVARADWSDTSLRVTDAEMDRDTKDRFEQQTILSVVAGGENQLDNWLLEYNLGYSKSQEEEPNRIDVSFAGEELTLGYDSAGPIPALQQSAAAHDLSHFELDEIELVNNDTQDKELSFSLNASRDFVWNNHNASVKAGLKHRSREKFNHANLQLFDGGFDDTRASLFATNAPDWSLGNFGPGLSREAIRQYFNQNRGQLELDPNESRATSLGESFTSEEDITSVYAMLDLDVNQWHINMGLRYEATDFSTRGNRVDSIDDEVSDSKSVEVTPWNVDKDYQHLFPSLNVRYSFSEKLLARFAYTQSIARPGFGDTAAFQIIETERSEDEVERKAEVGNPDLEPYESSNLDLSIEYYPGHIGVMSAGVFYKDIDNYIVQQEVQDNGMWQGFEEVLQPVNAGSAELKGIELAWSKTFDSGLLLAANGTWTDSDRKLPNQSDMVSNLTLGYEGDEISTRLTLTNKSKTYQFDDNELPVYQDKHSQLDLNVKYYLTDNSHIYFNAVNLTDEEYYLYHANRAYNYQYETYGRTFELGFSWKSF